VAAAVREWTAGPAATALRSRAADAARALGRPNAAREIAVRVLALADSARVASGSGERGHRLEETAGLAARVAVRTAKGPAVAPAPTVHGD
jgi:hypothetical protein